MFKTIQQMKKKDERGFTLIELLIVVAIIGILAAIAVPAYMGFTGKAKVSGAVQQVGAVKTGIDQFYADKSTFPSAGATCDEISTNIGVNINPQYVDCTATSTDVDGNITVTVANTGSSADGKTIVGHPVGGSGGQEGTLTWTWLSTTVDNKFLPAAMQH